MAFKLLCYKAYTIYARDEEFKDLLYNNPDLAWTCLENAVKADYFKFSEDKQSKLFCYLKYRFCQSIQSNIL